MQEPNQCAEGGCVEGGFYNTHMNRVNAAKRCANDAGFAADSLGLSSDDENDVHPRNSNQEQTKMSTLLPNGKKTKGRVKIKMEFIDNKLRRYTTFSKRKTGIMKKAYELSTLTGTQVMLLVASETGHVYTFATRKLQPMITSDAGKALIQTCLNSPDPPSTAHQQDQRMSATGYEEPELSYAVNEDDHKTPPLPDEYLNGSSSCSGSESSMPASPTSPSTSTSLTVVSSDDMLSSGLTTHGMPMHLPSGIVLSSSSEGGSVILGNSGGIYSSGKRVIYSSPTNHHDKTSSVLLKLPHGLQHISQHEGASNNTRLVSLPLELTSSAFQDSMNSSCFSTNESLPTDLSLPIKRENET